MRLDELVADAVDEVADDLPVVLGVLDHQDALRHAASMLLGGPHRDGDPERRALAENRLDRDGAAVHLDEPLRDREAKPGAALLAGRAAVDLLELLEDALLVVRRDARPGVAHRDVEEAVGGAGRDLDRALVGELDRIADEVQQHLRQPPLVAAADRQPLLHLRREREPLRLGERLRAREDRLHDLPDGVIVKREGELAGLDLRQVEHVVDEPEEVAAVGLDALQRLERLVRQLAVEPIGHHLGEAEDGVHRRAQLVAHVGEELRLVAARDLDLAALLLDLAEQARVLDRDHGLRREGLQQVEGRLREHARLLAANHEGADDAVRPQQRHDEEAAVAGMRARCRASRSAARR